MASLAPKHCLLLVFLILGVWASLSAASRDLSEMSMKERHKKWMARNGRVYKNKAVKAYRFKIFKANVEFIESFNTAGKHKYKLGANQFADLTNKEFKATYC